MEDKSKLDMTGAELISLASALAITFAQKYDKGDLRRLRMFFSSIVSNLAVIEIEGLTRKKENN